MDYSNTNHCEIVLDVYKADLPGDEEGITELTNEFNKAIEKVVKRKQKQTKRKYADNVGVSIIDERRMENLLGIHPSPLGAW